MLVLAGTSDKIKVVTSAAVTVDVHASWIDVTTTTATADRTNTLISTQTTTDVVGSPAASTVRTVRTLYLRNRHATSSVDVTVTHYDGTNTAEKIKVTLDAGDTLHYDARRGWQCRDNRGRFKARNDTLTGVVSNTMTTVVLASDVTNNNASANTIADVTGLSFSVTNGNKYWFRAVIQYTAAATTTGSRWCFNAPAGTYRVRSEYSLTTTSRTVNDGVSAVDSPAASNATSAATGSNIAIVEGFIEPSANGTVIIRFASEVSSSAIVAKAGSILQWIQVL